MIQWLGLSAFTAGAQVGFPGVAELRSCKPRSVAGKKKKKRIYYKSEIFIYGKHKEKSIGRKNVTHNHSSWN